MNGAARQPPALRGARARAAAAEAADGLLILAATCEMRVKNAIIVGSVRDGVAFTADRYAGTARAALLELADQADATSRHFAEAGGLARSSRGRGEHVHDYRRADVRNLTHKEAVQLAVAQELRRRATDAQVLRDLVLRARAAAWKEMAAALGQRLDRVDDARGSLRDAGYADRLAVFEEELVRLQRPDGSRPIGRLRA